MATCWRCTQRWRADTLNGHYNAWTEEGNRAYRPDRQSRNFRADKAGQMVIYPAMGRAGALHPDALKAALRGAACHCIAAVGDVR